MDLPAAVNNDRNQNATVETLPNTYEDNFGTDFSNAVTFAGPNNFPVSGGYDDEIDATIHNIGTSLPAAKDWAYPGKNWH